MFSTTGLNFVLFDFSQICKIEFTDKAELEYTIDGGVNWVKFNAIAGDPGQNCVYNGNPVSKTVETFLRKDPI